MNYLSVLLIGNMSCCVYYSLGTEENVEDALFFQRVLLGCGLWAVGAICPKLLLRSAAEPKEKMDPNLGEGFSDWFPFLPM